MDAYVITESSIDSDLIQRILPDDLRRDVEFVPAGGSSAVKSMARSLLVLRRKPVAIVVDADSIDEDSIESRRESMAEVVGSVSTSPFAVILAVPELESIFFQVPSLLRRYFSQRLSPDRIDRFIELGEVSSKRALKLLGLGVEDSLALLDALTPDELEALRETPPFRELSDFLRDAHNGSLGRLKAAT